jgi:hypothetical protein
MHFLQRSTRFSKTCWRPFASSFRMIVEKAVLTFHIRFSVSKVLPPLENPSPSHCVIYNRLDGWVEWFRNSTAQRWCSTKEISSCSAIAKRVLLKRPKHKLWRRLEEWRSRHYYVTPNTTNWHNSHLPLHSSGALPPVHRLFKRPSYPTLAIVYQHTSFHLFSNA